MNEYICPNCKTKCYSAAELEHMNNPTCEKCGGMNERSNMDYGELIKELQNFTYWNGCNNPASRDIHPPICDKAITALEALTAENAELKEQLSEARLDRNAEQAFKNHYKAENAKLKDVNKALESDNYNLNMNLEHITAEVTELGKAQSRKITLLNACRNLLSKQKESSYVLNLLCETVFYDEADCDGYCLLDDIEAELELLEPPQKG